MKLHELTPRPGAHHRRKRVARGIAAGHGKTAGRVEWHEVNLARLAGFKAQAEVTPATLVEAGLLRDESHPVALLGVGEISVPLKVRLHRVTRGARAKVEAAGGTVELLET
jgi:large subunit ribosomal protein L15